MKDRPPHYIDSLVSLEPWLAVLDRSDVVAVDTESDSFHHYREKVCLIQMTAAGEDAIIDPLALPTLEPLRKFFADEKRTKIFHDAGYDLLCLRRDYGFTVAGLFDTMLASRMLGARNFGLAAVLRERFQFEADKRLQRSDWARRPLSDEQIDYARFDTHFLPELTVQLTDELDKAGRLHWAREDFSRLPELAQRNAREPGFDPEGFWRIQGIKQLTPQARGRARALYILRDSIAQRLDRPPFKVFGDTVIYDMAEEPPRNLEEVGPRRGLRRPGVDRFGPEILAALADAKPINGRPPPGSGRRRRSGRFLDPEARDLYEDLRELRRVEAEKLGIEPEVALANATLEAIARDLPKTREDLLRGSQLAGWREPLFVDPIFRLISSYIPR